MEINRKWEKVILLPGDRIEQGLQSFAYKKAGNNNTLSPIVCRSLQNSSNLRILRNELSKFNPNTCTLKVTAICFAFFNVELPIMYFANAAFAPIVNVLIDTLLVNICSIVILAFAFRYIARLAMSTKQIRSGIAQLLSTPRTQMLPRLSSLTGTNLQFKPKCCVILSPSALFSNCCATTPLLIHFFCYRLLKHSQFTQHYTNNTSHVLCCR